MQIQQIINSNREAFVPSSPQSQAADLSRTDALKFHFVRVAESVCPGFRITDGNREILSSIFRWCLMFDGPLDPGKSLWLWGNIGTGKSTMLHIVKRFCCAVRPRDNEGEPYGFAIVTAAGICADYADKGWCGIEKYLNSRRLAIDELGRETLETGNYGNKINVIQQLLQSRYDKRYTHFTHVTTNRSMDEVKTLYGAHIYDRCKEMFNFINFNGSTFRKK